MKTKDIPSYTRNGNYDVDISLAYLLKALQGYIKDYGLEMSPDFQRAHVWTEKQQIKYVEHILKGGESARVMYFNCPDWHGSANKGNMVLVDGKQRIEALRRFLENEIPAFGTLLKDFEDNERILRNISCRVKFNINDLRTRAEVLQWYIDMNAGGIAHTKEEIAKVEKLLEKEKEND